MSKSLYLTTIEPLSGKSAIALGVMQLLLRDIHKVALFRPVMTIDPVDGKDYYTRLLTEYFKLEQPYDETYAFTLNEAREMMGSDREKEFVETILQKYKALEEKYDFVLCLGTDYQSQEATFEFDINAEIASNLGTPCMLVANARKKALEQVTNSVQHAVDAYQEKGVEIIAVLVNRCAENVLADMPDAIRAILDEMNPMPLVYALAENPTLGKPTMEDVRNWLDAKVLFGEDSLKAQVDNTLIAAMEVQNFLGYVKQGSLVITPGDRSDIILSSVASRLSHSYPDIAGILLTGGIRPSDTVAKLIEGWEGVPLAVLVTRGHTFKTIDILHALYGRIEPHDEVKTASALGTFEAHVNMDELRERLVSTTTTKITPRMFEYSLLQRARADKRHIVLPEGVSERILMASDILLRRGVVDITLLGKPAEVRSKTSQLGLDLSQARVVDPASSEVFEDYCATYHELRKHKGMSREMARDIMSDPTYFGTMMVYKDHAHGMVSGSITTTQQTIRPAFEFIKTAPGAALVSSVFLMCFQSRVLVFGDCAVNPDPNAEQLSEIALSSAETCARFGIEPRVALLSYSTGESGKGAQVEKVTEATRLAKQKAPHLPIEGPIQYDAAIDPEVARTKMPDSDVAGRATVFIFPDLNTGNNTYKAVQRAAGAVAIGPVLQGLRKPVNDLSRGCTVADIVNTVAITAIQAQGGE